jgi:hypothetical protein
VKIAESNFTAGQIPQLKLKLADYSKSARVHLFAQHFVAPQTNTLCDEVMSLQ